MTAVTTGAQGGSGEVYWRGHVEAWRSSGQSRGDYCARHGLSRQTFGWWAWRLGRGTGARQDTTVAAGFVPVVVTDDATDALAARPQAPELGPAADGRIEIVLPDGLLVRVGAGIDAGALRRVLAVLGR